MDEPKYPEPTVGALIFNKEGDILLLKSVKWSNNYSIPGGHIEIGEKFEDALKREIKEETGLDIYDIKLISLLDSIFDKSFDREKHFIFIDFVCKTDSDRVVLNHESQEYIWISIPESLKLALNPTTRRFIQEYVKGESSEYLNHIFYNY